MENEKILITGAGPTGLSLANLLSRMGTPFMLIDKNAHPSRESKAFGIHARTLEVFDQIGMAEKVISEGSIDNTVHFFIKDRETAKIRLKDILPGESNFPFFLVLEQYRTEEILIDSLEAHELKVNWKHELTKLSENDEGILVTIKDPLGKEKELQFQYLIGCDGAGSIIREQAGFAFKGKTFSPCFYLADCEFEGGIEHGDSYFTLAPSYITGIFSFREKGKFRLFNFMNPSVGKDEDEELTFGDVQKILDSNPYLDLKVKNMEWSSVFRIHARLAESFQKGRVFLAGDAAHVHSPAAGQGMNTGIQDTYNLAWKLSFVISGIAKPELLKTYTQERMPIAQNLHNTTDRFFQLMIQPIRILNLFRLYFFPVFLKILFNVKRFRKKNLRRFSQLAIKYRQSPLSRQGSNQEFKAKAPEAGDRAPFCKIDLKHQETDIFKLFHCTHFTLLIADATPKNTIAEKIMEYFTQNTQLPIKAFFIANPQINSSFFNTYGIKKTAVFVIRPDGHIGFRSSSIDQGELESYFSDFFYLTKN